jgi:predicted SprT family Zn-dependent metalloprotease
MRPDRGIEDVESASRSTQNSANFVHKALHSWGKRWRCEALVGSVSVTFSPRLRTTLGRATPETSRVALHTALQYAAPSVLLEVLCHEVAHVVAYRRALEMGVARPRPHGAEWATLVRAAGYEARVRAPRSSIPELTRDRIGTGERRRNVLHVCPVCHARRLARRAVPGWRCAACVGVGLDGRMDVVRLARLARD